MEAQELSLAVLLPACTRNLKVHPLPEHNTVVLLNKIQTLLHKFLSHNISQFS